MFIILDSYPGQDSYGICDIRSFDESDGELAYNTFINAGNQLKTNKSCNQPFVQIIKLNDTKYTGQFLIDLSEDDDNNVVRLDNKMVEWIRSIRAGEDGEVLTAKF